MLSSRPRYWQELETEARTQSGKSENFAEIVSMPWHKAVITETLRLFPPAWLFPRIATRDTVIDSVSIPAGSQVLLSPWVTERNHRYLENPEEFRPERWMNSDWTLKRGSFFPFGLGSRICMGERYAKLTATVMLRELSRYPGRPEVQSNDSDGLIASLISSPSTRHHLTLSAL